MCAEAGVADHARGLVGLMVDSDVPGFQEAAAAILGLLASAPPAAPGRLGAGGAAGPTSSSNGDWGGQVTAAAPAAAAAARAAQQLAQLPPGRRALLAGGWAAVCTCLSSAGSACPSIPGIAAAAIMFLSKEVCVCVGGRGGASCLMHVIPRGTYSQDTGSC